MTWVNPDFFFVSLTSPSGRKYIANVVKLGTSSVGAGIRGVTEKRNTYPFKKIIIGIGLSIVLTLAAVPSLAKQPVRFTAALGTIWDNDSFHNDFLWILGLSADFYLVKNLTLSPEFYLAGREFDFKNILLQPGLMFNYHQPRFFVGAGVVNESRARNQWFYEGMGYPRIVVWHVVWSNVWKLKLNAGFKISKIRFTAFLITRFDDIGWFPTATSNAYGAMIGYTF